MSDFDDVTQFMPIKSADIGSVDNNDLHVQILGNDIHRADTQIFTQYFTLGRGEKNDCIVNDSSISRNHLEFKSEFGNWYLLDQCSTNGTAVNDVIVKKGDWIPLSIPCQISFGATHTKLNLSKEQFQCEEVNSVSSVDMTVISQFDLADSVSHTTDVKEDIERRFLSTDNASNIGDYTKMVRGVIAHDRKKQKKWRGLIVFVSALLLVGATTLIVLQQNSINRARNIAIEMFYDVKTLEIDLSNTELQLKQEHSNSLQQSVLQKRVRLQNMQSKYQAYLNELSSMDFKQLISMSREDELILKVARAFGESELELPTEFVQEVKRYIEYWKKTPRMSRAMEFMKNNNYLPIVADAMAKENLPRQFLYVSLQESNFNPRAIGPETRFGIAKGAWQFLPSTGEEFGLKPGDLSGTRDFDEADERFDFEKATYAAAKYLKHIYTTEAQASGLLVMAGYNFGHNRVKRMIRNMPDNPKQRNFWRFLKQYEDRVPKETRDYVFYIFSAAVIGEDPAYFGFDFEAPSSSM